MLLVLWFIVRASAFGEGVALSTQIDSKRDANGIVEVGDVETLFRTLAGASPNLLFQDWRFHGFPTPDAYPFLPKAYTQLKIVPLSVGADDGTVSLDEVTDFIIKGTSPGVDAAFT